VPYTPHLLYKARIMLRLAARRLSSFAEAKTLTVEGAQKAMAAAAAEAQKNNWKVTVAVSDAGGHPLMVQRYGAAPFSVEVAMGKARTAALFQRETAGLEAASNVADGKARTALLSTDFILMEGGVPIMTDGVCVGAVGVSGVLPTQDAQVAKAGVGAI